MGQLKYIGNQVWSQLTNAGYAPSLPTWLATADAGDQSGAVIGQLKTVFNFDTTTFVSAPHITSATTASGTVGTAFSYTLTANNTPTSYAVSGLPAGLSFNATTRGISGTPTVAGVFPISLSASNSSGMGYGTLTLTVVLSAPVITSAATATATTGTAFTYTIVASKTPTSFNATGLPAGLTINTATGIISGTPTSAATSSITLSAINAGGTGTKVLTLTVKPPVPVITSPATAFATKGAAFTYSIIASNSPTSYSASSLPSGLTLNTTTGVISGSPTSTSVTTVTVTLRALNAASTGTQTLALNLNSATYDSDGNGLPDVWEIKYFGHIGNNPNSSPDGNGLTLLQDYQQGSDPTNYYSQAGQLVVPAIAVSSGNSQVGVPGTFTEIPLVVSVTNSTGGALLPNAPVTFTAARGLLSATSGGTTSASLAVVSNGSGLAQVYFQQPSANSASSTITAVAAGKSTSFSETTQAGTGTFDAPDHITTTSPNPAEIDLTWVNHATTATGIVIQQSTDGINWTPTVTLSNPATTSYSVTGLTPGLNYTFRIAGTK